MVIWPSYCYLVSRTILSGSWIRGFTRFGGLPPDVAEKGIEVPARGSPGLFFCGNLILSTDEFALGFKPV